MVIRREFWRLAWPAAAEGLLLMLLSAADLLMVSALGTTAVAAVSIFSQPRMVILCVTRSFAVALSAHVARLRGKQPGYLLTGCSRASFLLGTTVSILILIGTWAGAVPLLQLAGAQDDYLTLALQYAFPALVSLALSGPAIVLHGILAGLGDTRSVLLANVLGNGVNVVCNGLLIFGLGPFPRLGVFGAGVGTAVGTAVTLAYTLYLFLRRNQSATLRGRGRWLPERAYLRAVVPLTAGVFLEQAAERLGMFTFSRMVADLGASALSIHNICGSLCDIYYSFSQGLGKASLVQAGQDLGAAQGKHLRQIAAVSRQAVLWTGGTATLLYFLLRIPLLQFYHLSGHDLELGCRIMLFVAAINIPEAWAMVHAGILRGLGRTGFVATYSLLSIAIVRPILTFVLIFMLDFGLYGAWIALSLDQTTRAVCSMLGAHRVMIKTQNKLSTSRWGCRREGDE